MGAPVYRGGLPPRRGAVKAITVDSTARSYNIIKLALGDQTPDGSASTPVEVDLYMQAQTNDVFFYFTSTSGTSDLSDTAALAAGAASLTAFEVEHCAVLEAGELPVCFRINRAVDKHLVVKAASTSGFLRFWAAAAAE